MPQPQKIIGKKDIVYLFPKILLKKLVSAWNLGKIREKNYIEVIFG